ncbi:MAG TPA: lysophospholipid acyltransferase family protein [Longimicrobium sp.]|nr:lysophospholipid acyltransferase family protein [Longimicrobium sp.]
MFYLRMFAALLAFVAASTYGVAIALARRDRSRVAHDYAHLLHRWMLPIFRQRVTVRGAEHLTAHRPCIFIANHQSLLDVPVLAVCFAPGSVVIAKKEIRTVPFFGWLYMVTGNLLIDRGNTAQSVGMLRAAEDAIRERRVAVWIFPEGTRSKVAGELLPFKKGGFRMAVATGAPLVPVVASPLKPKSDLVLRRLDRNDIEIRVLEPIPTAGLGEGDVIALMHEAQRRMGAALAEMAAERGILPNPQGPVVGSGGGGASGAETGGGGDSAARSS